MKIAVPMSQEMVGFLDTQAEELSHLLEGKTTRADIVRECVARIAWDYFDIDVE